MDAAEYAGKLAAMEPKTLLPVLEDQQAGFIRQLAHEYRFTYQELRQISQAARDFQMWGVNSLQRWWIHSEEGLQATGRERKKTMLRELRKRLAELEGAAKEYPPGGFTDPPRRSVRLQEANTSRKLLGLCPAYSEETVCCGLHTLDAVRGCPFSCSYCTIQTFYGDTAELESDLVAKLSEIDLDPRRRYHIGTGQASDSLVWGNRGGALEALLGFADDHPNVLLELKTKSANVAHLTTGQIPDNVVCTWTLNTPTVIENEEKGTATLRQRLNAARIVADRGIAVGFHFHPMVFYRGWGEDYPSLARMLMDSFAPTEVSFISMGTVTLIKPVIQEIRRRGGDTKILQMDRITDHHGKLTYPDPIKIRLFENLHVAFRPWHQEVFFYLCMETARIWEAVLGYAYPDNGIFEKDFLDHCLPRSAVSSHPALA